MNSFVKKLKNVSYLHKFVCPKILGQGIKLYKSSKKYKSWAYLIKMYIF